MIGVEVSAAVKTVEQDYSRVCESALPVLKYLGEYILGRLVFVTYTLQIITPNK